MAKVFRNNTGGLIGQNLCYNWGHACLFILNVSHTNPTQARPAALNPRPSPSDHQKPNHHLISLIDKNINKYLRATLTLS